MFLLFECSNVFNLKITKGLVSTKPFSNKFRKTDAPFGDLHLFATDCI